jgi:FkbM family methyltransferase
MPRLKGLLDLAREFTRSISHYDRVLPHNLNWRDVRWTAAERFLGEHPFSVIDIGSRGGSPPELDRLQKHLRYNGFEADAGEARKLESSIGRTFAECRVYPYFVGDHNGKQQFHVLQEVGSSSSLRPNPDFANRFSRGAFQVVRTSEVESWTLDSVVEREAIPPPDFMKLDTQGSELSILQAGEKTLKVCPLVEVEVEFVSQYLQQPLFQDVCTHMYDNGFVLLYLNRVFGTRNNYQGRARGQILFGDALFGRTDESLSGFDDVRIAKYVLLLINYGHKDIAADIVMSHPSVLNLIPRIDSFFERPSKLDPIVRAAFMQLDKIIAFLLWLRRTNQRRFDSDRSWPIR